MSQVEGINGMYLANKLVDDHIKTFITYNKGQTWALLPAPATDVVGNNLNCLLVSSADWNQRENRPDCQASNIPTSSAVPGGRLSITPPL